MTPRTPARPGATTPTAPAGSPARGTGPGGPESGSAAVELTLLAPLLVLLLLLVVAGGRQVHARAQVDAAAQAAARAATTARTPAGAATAAREAVAAGLATGSASCRAVDVAVDTTDFAPGGTARVTVTCTVDLGDLAGLGLPGSRRVTSTAAARIDVYRGV